jgi:hypothetical protein
MPLSFEGSAKKTDDAAEELQQLHLSGQMKNEN